MDAIPQAGVEDLEAVPPVQVALLVVDPVRAQVLLAAEMP